MPRTCKVCVHADRPEIDKAIISGGSLRDIAGQYTLSKSAVERHREHIPQALTRAQEAREVARADDLLREVRALRSKAISILLQAEAAGDLRTALAGVREARECLQLLAKLSGELDERPVINVLISPEWVAVRSVLMTALVPYPEARIAVADRLALLEAGN
jgi:hypothetical protein